MIGDRMIKRILLPVLVALIFHAQCGFLHSDKAAVAEIGKRKIALGEFRYNYEHFLLYPTNFDSPANRRAFLQSMIDQRLLADRGSIRGLQNNEVLRGTLPTYREKLGGGGFLEK